MTDTLSELRQQVMAAVAAVGRGEYRDGSSTQEGRPYQPIPFNEFADVPAQKPEPVEREWRLIAPTIPATAKSLLDVGANIGFYSWKLAKAGFADVVAVETDPANLAVLNALRAWSGLAQVAVATDLDAVLDWRRHFDVGLMLNVHHWIVKDRGFDATTRLMWRIARQVDVLYFQTAHRGQASLYCVDELDGPLAVANHLHDVGFADVELLSASQHGDARYLFRASTR